MRNGRSNTSIGEKVLPSNVAAAGSGRKPGHSREASRGAGQADEFGEV